MMRALRVLAGVVVLLGLGVAGVAGWLVAADAHFAEVAAAYARHPDHTLFQTEYWIAAARRYGLLAAAVGGLVGGLTLGGVLLALAELLRRVPPR
ncbi:MAG TPA: hypothetical protein VFD84_14095 [Candidatus Binatia bacterium]|jgi:hypothetical protein|nr:hypothetical protein [Candidatus Binatia bacterium]